MNNLNLIIGEDKKIIDFYVIDLLKKINYNDEDKLIYDFNTSNLTNILDEASMISLFSHTKIIIVNNFDISKIDDNEAEYLTKYIDNYSKDVYLIFIANKIDARTKIYKEIKDKFNIIDISKTDNTDNLIKYINNLLKKKKYKMDTYNIEYFLEKTGNDINNINSELTKLFIYKSEDKTILREDIDLLIIDNIDNVIYEFTNAILEKDLPTIARMYNNFKKENVGIDYLITSLANVFRQALIIKLMASNKSNLEIAKVIGKKEFFVKKTLERIAKFTIADLSKFITKLADIDYQYKSGKSNTDMLELFLYDIER